MRTAPALALALATCLARPAAAAHFGWWDADHDGTVSPAEFRAGLDHQGTIARFDTDADGTLDVAEYGMIVYAVMDRDGNGAVSVPEWRAYLASEGLDPDTPGDVDGDGLVSRIEFAVALRGRHLLLPDDGGTGPYTIAAVDATLFRHFDRNRDGHLDSDEFGSDDLRF